MIEKNTKTIIDGKDNFGEIYLKNTLEMLNEELKELLTALEQNNWAKLIELQQLPSDFTLPELPANELEISADISVDVKELLVTAILRRFGDLENGVLQNLEQRYPLLMQDESIKSEMSEAVDNLHHLLEKLADIRTHLVEMTGDDPVSVSS